MSKAKTALTTTKPGRAKYGSQIKEQLHYQIGKQLLAPTDDFAADCETGSALAWQLIEEMRKDDFGGTLGWVVYWLSTGGHKRTKGSQYNGRVVGFCHVFGLVVCKSRVVPIERAA